MGFLAGKRLLITGVLNNRSLAYGIARACHREGAELAFSYQGERFKERIPMLVKLLEGNRVLRDKGLILMLDKYASVAQPATARI